MNNRNNIFNQINQHNNVEFKIYKKNSCLGNKNWNIKNYSKEYIRNSDISVSGKENNNMNIIEI